MFARLRYRGINFTLNSREFEPTLAPPTEAAPSSMFYVYVDDVPAATAAMREAGASVLGRPAGARARSIRLHLGSGTPDLSAGERLNETFLHQHARVLGDDMRLAGAADHAAPALQQKSVFVQGKGEPAVHAGVTEKELCQRLQRQDFGRYLPDLHRVDPLGTFRDQMRQVGIPSGEFSQLLRAGFPHLQYLDEVRMPPVFGRCRPVAGFPHCAATATPRGP